jgi:preprotein translocase subunit SecG
MYYFVLTLHLILCALLILIILMQPGKGGDMSSTFGGGAATQIFGASGPGNLLTRGTGVIAALFMVTSVGLSLYSTQSSRSGTDIDESLEKVQEDVEEGSGFGVGDKAPAATPADAPATPAPAAPAPAAPAPAAPAPAAPAPGAPAAPVEAPPAGGAAPAAN